MNPVHKLICETPVKILVALVMVLTGGSANPSVVEAQVARVRKEEGVA